MAQEFQKRGLKLIMDQVPNHSSDQHEWFKKSVQRIDPYTDYFVWRDAKGYDQDGKPIPPSNWIAVFGGSSWEWNEQRGQFYLHQFVIEQPDLNFENIEVRNEVLAIFKFWLDAGSKPGKADGKIRCMMVEAGVPPEAVKDYYGTKDKPVSHFPFNFNLLRVTPEQNASEVLGMVNAWYDAVPEGQWATFLLGNHDQKRVPTRWTEGSIDGANMINLLLQGTAVTYNGEEIGMTDLFLTWEETVDPKACNTDPERVLGFSRVPSESSGSFGFLVLVNLSEDSLTVNATVFDGVPLTGTVRTRSVGFHVPGTVIGGSINTRAVELGPRDSIVVEFNPLY
ncbi:unnamed protein product [Allacma fusca]|uniref:alpha-glucosidase n=1 Tax=Allacma fusca TaxID=39272 RepID=A0A8J2LIL0_9HEXA|nr:unnamed protein product [Allacma fusca]